MMISRLPFILGKNKWQPRKGLEIDKSTQYKVQDHNENFKQQVLSAGVILKIKIVPKYCFTLKRLVTLQLAQKRGLKEKGCFLKDGATLSPLCWHPTDACVSVVKGTFPKTKPFFLPTTFELEEKRSLLK